MRIFVSKQRNNIFSFLYFSDIDDNYFFHSLSLSMEIKVKDNDLFRVLISSSPFDFSSDNYIEVKGLKISPYLKDYFEKLYKIQINCDVSDDDELKGKDIIYSNDIIFLGFSGGFDSLAAKQVLPNNIQCVSIEYGGAFQRESDFFKMLDTTIIKWDLRNYRDNSYPKFKESMNWRFMVAPITLFRGKGNKANIIISTGTILEASPFWFTSDKRKVFESYSDFGLGKGVSLINPLAGITEYSTTKIVLNSFDDSFVFNSLKSLAPLDSFKYHRKICLIAAVKNDYSNVPIPKERHKLGSSFADDLFTLYFCWKFGLAWAKKFYAENIPDDIQIHNMSFIEKLNTRNLMVLDEGFRDYIVKKILRYDIDVYVDEDYKNLELVKIQLIDKKFTL